MTAPTETPGPEDEDDCVTMTAEPGVVDRLVEALAPSLTTEQARAYAACWAETEGRARGERDSSVEFDTALDEAEREQLFAWVRAWMAERKRAGNLDACIGEALGLDDIDAAHALAHEATKAGPS